MKTIVFILSFLFSSIALGETVRESIQDEPINFVVNKGGTDVIAGIFDGATATFLPLWGHPDAIPQDITVESGASAIYGNLDVSNPRTFDNEGTVFVLGNITGDGSLTGSGSFIGGL